MKRLRKNGFTLMETVVALSIAAVALSFFVAAYAPATIGIQRANSVKEAKFLASALEAELNTFRPNLDTGATNSFEKTANLVAPGAGYLLAHKYRADITRDTADGIAPGFTGDEITAADSMSVKSFVRDIGGAITFGGATPPLNSIEGSCFAVELTRLDSAGGTLASTNTAVDSSTPVILVQAKFYLLESNAPAYLTAVNAGTQDLLKRPIYTTRFGIKR